MKTSTSTWRVAMAAVVAALLCLTPAVPLVAAPLPTAPLLLASDSTYQFPCYVARDTGLFTCKAAAGPGLVSDNGSVVYNIRTRTSIANVNTGVTLLPAIPGYKYRLIDATVISVGGAFATCTALTISGTQSTSAAVLLSIAIAALTQSTVVKPNTSNVTVLADGASFVQNDVNTAITIAKTGSSCATATNVDTILTVAIE